jgi:hypothetical protein
LIRKSTNLVDNIRSHKVWKRITRIQSELSSRARRTTTALMMNAILVLQSTNLSCQQSRSQCVASIWKWIGPIESESCSRARKRTTSTDGKY